MLQAVTGPTPPLKMPPPNLPTAFLIVTSEIVTDPIDTTRNTVPAALPSTASRSAPGPFIVTLLLTSNFPLVSVITPLIPVASIVSPSFASASAWRSEPGPLSLVLVTITVAACAELMRAQAKSKRIAAALTFGMLVRLGTACEVPAFKGDVVVTFANHPTYAVALATARLQA